MVRSKFRTSYPPPVLYPFLSIGVSISRHESKTERGHVWVVLEFMAKHYLRWWSGATSTLVHGPPEQGGWHSQ